MSPPLEGGSITPQSGTGGGLSTVYLTGDTGIGINGVEGVQQSSDTFTVTIRYGSSANTAVQGNDSRVPVAPGTQGSILYDTGIGWGSLGPGTAGWYLQSAGPGANPAWVAATPSGNVTLTGQAGVAINGVHGSAQVADTHTVSMRYGAVASLGAADANGSTDSAARSDHVHKGVKSAVAGSGISVSAATGDVTIGNTGVLSAQGANGIAVNGESGVAKTGTVTITPTYSTSVQDIAATGAAGVADTASRGDHTHKGVLEAQGLYGIMVNGVNGAQASGTLTITPTYGTGASLLGPAASGGALNTFSRSDHMHPGPYLGANELSGYVGGYCFSQTLIPSTGLTMTADYEAPGASERVTITMANTAVTPGTYGDASNVGQFTVDQQGRLTAAANVPIAASSGNVTLTGQNGITINGEDNVAQNGSTFTVTPAYGTVQALGNGGSNGTADSASRSDHKHGAPFFGANYVAAGAALEFQIIAGDNITAEAGGTFPTRVVTVTGAAFPTIAVTLTGQNGITVNGVDNVAQNGSTFTVTPAYSATAASLGAANAAGSADTASRGDHVHAGPTIGVDDAAGTASSGLNLVAGSGVTLAEGGAAGGTRTITVTNATAAFTGNLTDTTQKYLNNTDTTKKSVQVLDNDGFHIGTADDSTHVTISQAALTTTFQTIGGQGSAVDAYEWKVGANEVYRYQPTPTGAATPVGCHHYFGSGNVGVGNYLYADRIYVSGPTFTLLSSSATFSVGLGGDMIGDEDSHLSIRTQKNSLSATAGTLIKCTRGITGNGLRLCVPSNPATEAMYDGQSNNSAFIQNILTGAQYGSIAVYDSDGFVIGNTLGTTRVTHTCTNVGQEDISGNVSITGILATGNAGQVTLSNGATEMRINFGVTMPNTTYAVPLTVVDATSAPPVQMAMTRETSGVTVTFATAAGENINYTYSTVDY